MTRLLVTPGLSGLAQVYGGYDATPGEKLEKDKFKRSIKEQESIVRWIILKSFITYDDKIKQDQELIEAYEDILEILIDLNYEYAAVILDEFRIH